MNQRPSGYEPDELPDCSTPRRSEHTTTATPANGGQKVGYGTVVVVPPAGVVVVEPAAGVVVVVAAEAAPASCAALLTSA